MNGCVKKKEEETQFPSIEKITKTGIKQIKHKKKQKTHIFRPSGPSGIYHVSYMYVHTFINYAYKNNAEK